MMQNAVNVSEKCDKENAPTEKKISCCGAICSDCGYYPVDCQGCTEIKGIVFWLEKLAREQKVFIGKRELDIVVRVTKTARKDYEADGR